MKKLIWLESLVSKEGLLLAAAFYFFFLVIAIFDGDTYLLYIVPGMLESLVLSRSVIHFARGDIDKLYILLPVKTSKIIGSKYLFHNILLLIFTIVVNTSHYAIQLSGDFESYNLSFALLFFAIGSFVVNITLLEHYLIGPADTQLCAWVNMLIAICFIKPIMRSPVTLNTGVITALIAVGISILFYIGTCIYIAVNANGRINVREIMNRIMEWLERWQFGIKRNNANRKTVKPQGLFWLEWIVCRKGLAVGTVLAFLFFFIVCMGIGRVYYLYSLPSFIAISVILRSSVVFDQEGMDKFLILLPGKIERIVRTKYVFYNGLLLSSTLLVGTVCFLLFRFHILPEFNGIHLLAGFCLGYALVNLALLGYYFLGAANMQFFMIAGYLALFWFSGQMAGVLLGPQFIFILPAGLLFLAWGSYKLACFRVNSKLTTEKSFLSEAGS